MKVPIHIHTIVPRLPPAVDGLGDYGLLVARQLRQDFGWNTTFIVGDPTWDGAPTVDGFPVRRISHRSTQGLLDILTHEGRSPSMLLLHYVGYGYARRGSPTWLIHGLDRWKAADGDRHLITMFHELYAVGAPWTSAFWTSPWQRYLASRLAELSDRLLTSNQGYADKLQILSRKAHAQIPAIPVFSNVGELQNPLPLAKRQRWLVVFGGWGARRRVYGRSRNALEHICRRLEIEHIFDVGPSSYLDRATIGTIPIKGLGIQSPSAISQLLAQASVGFFDYPIPYLAKSGIFAAYCAHGMLPVGGFYPGKPADGLAADTHYWVAPAVSMDEQAGQAIASNAHRWYQSHCLSIQAKTFAAQTDGFLP